MRRRKESWRIQWYSFRNTKQNVQYIVLDIS